MRIKKWFGLLAGLLLLVAVLSTLAFAANTVTIQYAFWGDPNAIGVEKDIIEGFEKNHPNIKVTPIVSAYNDYHAKLLTLFAGGQAPDVMRIDSYFMADFMKNKALKDITPYIKRDKIDMNAYYQAGLLDNMQGGKYYGLPWGTAPIFMFVNVKMFKDAGIPIPSVDWTYDDFVKIARQLSKGEGADRQYGYALNPTDLGYFFPFIWAHGGDLFDKNRKKFTLDQPQSIQGIQAIVDLIKDGTIPDPAQFTSAAVVNRWMTNHKVALRTGTAQEIITLQRVEGFEFEVLPCPGTAKNPNVTISKSNVTAMSASTKKDKAAWEFLKYMRAPGQEGEMLYMKAKRVPPSIDDQKLWEAYADPTKSPKNVVAVAKAVASKYGHTLPLRVGWNEIQGLLIPQLQRVFAGQTTAEQAMKDLAPRVKDVLDRTSK